MEQRDVIAPKMPTVRARLEAWLRCCAGSTSGSVVGRTHLEPQRPRLTRNNYVEMAQKKKGIQVKKRQTSTGARSRRH